MVCAQSLPVRRPAGGYDRGHPGRAARFVVNYSSSAKEAEQTADLAAVLAAVVVVQATSARRGLYEDRRCRLGTDRRAGDNNAVSLQACPACDLDGLSAEDFQRCSASTPSARSRYDRARSLLEAGANASGRASAVVNASSVASNGGVGCRSPPRAAARSTPSPIHSRGATPLIRVTTIRPGGIDTAWYTKGRGEAAPSARRGGGECRRGRLQRRIRDLVLFARPREQHDRRIGADGRDCI